MALEDIEKLKEKVAKDPNSKLFVPLADEYRKMGMFDEAISVLLDGLNNQPGYMSARVSLGKVYLEKKMLAEAKEEFEKVITAIPDNLFAHKKVAELYRDAGEKDKAVREYKAVLKLNPLDEDAMTNLEALQSTHGVEEKAPVPAEHVLEQTRHEEPLAFEPAPEAEALEDEVEMLPAEEPLQTVSEDEFEEFKKAIDGRDSEAGVLAAEEVVAEEVVEEESVPETVISDDEIEDVEKEALAYVDMFKEPEAGPSAPVFQPEPFSDRAISKSEPLTGRPLEKTEKVASDIKGGLRDAELFISECNYYKAMKLYRDMLPGNPQDKYLLQKIEELKMLLKMLGKEKDVAIDKLKAFDAGIKKRKDEFLRNS